MVKKVIKKAGSRESEPEAMEESIKQPPAIRTKRGCVFCGSKSSPIFTDIVTLRRFITDRGRIIPKLKSGLCSKHQRRVTKQIKYARHLALLPFTLKV